MARIVEIKDPLSLDEYAALAFLAPYVDELRAEAATLVPALRGRKVWMINSTAQGGGVAEMLPKMLPLLRELGLDIDWAVIETDRVPFFDLTKRIHNMIHGVDRPQLSAADRELFELVGRENADVLLNHVSESDIVVVHDPQPIEVGRILNQELGVKTIWRCHIGLPDHLSATRDAWQFLEPYATTYDHSIFSAPEYIPSYLAGTASVIHPAIDPLSEKNRDIHAHRLSGILCNAGLAVEYTPVLTAPFLDSAKQLTPDGSWVPPCEIGDIGLLTRPIVMQISRWDRLKGWNPLLDAFAKLKRRHRGGVDDFHRRRLEILRLVLAGPDPSSVADDPEGQEVIHELSESYLHLDPQVQRDVVLLSLPMESARENALIVNALQRCATVIAQNSLQEGFGLTVTEAMWKRAPVMGSQACGLRQQIRDRIDGRLVEDAEDSEGIARILDEMLADRSQRQQLGRAGQRRVYKEFLVFTQLRRWLEVLADVAMR